MECCSILQKEQIRDIMNTREPEWVRRVPGERRMSVRNEVHDGIIEIKKEG